MGLSSGQKAVIHIAKQQLGLSDEDYRAALAGHGGVSSSRDLNRAGFLRVMKHFEACGFASRKGKGGSRRTAIRGQKTEDRGQNRPGMATVRQIKKIYALWWTLEGIWYKEGMNHKALREFIKKQYRVAHENFLTFEMAHNCIEAIKQIGIRNGAEVW